MTLTTRLDQAKFEFRSLVSREPWLAPLHRPVVWWTQYKQRDHIDVRECRVDAATEFVLDGFQGSGNSWATVAFKSAQPSPVRMAHHLHAPAQIIKAVDLGIPTLVTIREPDRAAVSLVSRWPNVTLRQALRSYTAFYDKLVPYADGFILSPFEQTIHHLDEVIEAVNAKFGQSFVPFRPDGKNARSVRKSTTLQPEEEHKRQEKKRRLLDEVGASRNDDVLQDALQTYHNLVAFGAPRN